jgi:hypothetical protein
MTRALSDPLHPATDARRLRARLEEVTSDAELAAAASRFLPPRQPPITAREVRELRRGHLGAAAARDALWAALGGRPAPR